MCLLFASLSFAALEITTPSFNQEFAFDKSPTFSWSGCDADSYLLQIASDGLFDSMIYQSSVSSSTFDLPVDLSSKKYFARVYAIGPTGEFSCTSPTTEFIIKEYAPLSFFFDTSKYESESLLITTVKGPKDAKVSIEVSSSQGFFLPIVLNDLKDPTFELELSSGVYTFQATSSYADGELSANQDITLGTVKKTTTTTSAVVEDDGGLYNLTILVKEFEGDFIDDPLVIVRTNESNKTVVFNQNNTGSLLLEKGSYTLHFEKEGYVTDDDELELEEDTNMTFIVIADDVDGSPVEESTTKKVVQETSTYYEVTLKPFLESAYATNYLPVIFETIGSFERCQVLMKNDVQPSYQIAQTVLDLNEVNQVILTELYEGENQVRVRCIVSPEEAYVTDTYTVSIIDIETDITSLETNLKNSQSVVNKINGFPSSFKQIFINDVIVLEGYIAKIKELLKKAKSSTDLLQVQDDISSLNSVNAKNILTTVVIDNSQSIISYGSLDDAKVVIKYLDLSKNPKRLLEEQEQFAIKTNYNFVTLTYSSGEIIKQTFVSNQILAIDGVRQDISYDEYYVMPSFLAERLSPANDVLVKKYDQTSLVRILENSSALIFNGWVDDTSLIRTIVLADGETLEGSTPTGFVIDDVDTPTWKIPLIAFIIVILLAGLFFNPYYSVLDAFEKDRVQQFTSRVHECIDASVTSNYDKVIQLIPKILDTHEKMSKEQQAQTQEIITNVRELFYDATYQTTYKKITSKPAEKWMYEELQVAIKDFYGSYAKLSPGKQRAYLHHFNQMLQYCEKLLDQVKK